jgi:hypothetical protein
MHFHALENNREPGQEDTTVEGKMQTEIALRQEVGPGQSFRRTLKWMRDIHERTKARLRNEILHVPGLMALLMKPRNGMSWSRKDRRELRERLLGIGRLSLYLAVLTIPGTTLTLPLLAWWIDRRRFPRRPPRALPRR